MKCSKKLASLLLAVAIALPLAVAGVNAEETNVTKAIIPFMSADDSGNKLAGAQIQFYRETTPIFKSTTREDGKLNPLDAPDYINENGEVMLGNGDYSFVEVNSPSGYMLNTDVNKFSVKNGASSSLNLENRKYPEGKGQLIIKAINKLDYNLEGAVIDVYSKKGGDKNNLVATFTTDSNGNILSSFSKGVVDAGLESVGNVVAINPGTYYIKENKAPQGYHLSEKEYTLNVVAGSQARVYVEHILNGEGNRDPQSIKTGVRIRVIDNAGKPVEGLDVAIYGYTKKNEVSDKELFIGRTGKDGYIVSSSLGSDLLDNGVVELKQGTYATKLYKLKGATHDMFEVIKGKISSHNIKVKVSSTNTNLKKGNSSKSNGSTLAKTGLKDSTLMTVLGLILVGLGVAVIRKKQYK